MRSLHIVLCVCTICIGFVIFNETSNKTQPQMLPYHPLPKTQTKEMMWLDGVPDTMINEFKRKVIDYKEAQLATLKNVVMEQEQKTLHSSSIPPPPFKPEIPIIPSIPSVAMTHPLISEDSTNPKVLLFIIIRSKDSNTKMRETARNTWLSSEGLVNPSLAQYRFFVDKVGCCQEESDREKDLVVASSTWLHSNFTHQYGETLGYKDLAWGGEGFSTQNYARDWDINLILWATKNYNFKYIVSIDDDAFLCGRHLIHQLSLLPTTLSSFVFGYRRWDAFDNCFILITRDIADFFALHYYNKLRPTHHPSTHFNFKGAGSSFGGAWSIKVGNWVEVFNQHGFNIIFRNGGISESCVACSKLLTKEGNKNDLCNSDKEDYWKYKCGNASTDTGHCKLPDCFPNPTHRCHAPLVDHRTFNDAWTLVTKNPNFYFHDPSKVCMSRFIFDKMKNIPDMNTWWNLTGPHTLASKYPYSDLSQHLLYPNQAPKICRVVNPTEPARVGPDVHPVLNFQHHW